MADPLRAVCSLAHCAIRNIGGRAAHSRASSVRHGLPLGGDEFVVLLPEIEHAEHAAAVGEKRLRAVGAPHLAGSREISSPSSSLIVATTASAPVVEMSLSSVCSGARRSSGSHALRARI